MPNFYLTFVLRFCYQLMFYFQKSLILDKPYPMSQHPYREDREALKELLRLYDNLRNGRPNSFLHEDDFERIINYFDEKDDLHSALEATELSVEQYPFSSSLMIRKADILLAMRKYQEALQVLDQASLMDSQDVDLYILKTDAYLALDQQADAVEVLQEALALFDGEERVDLLFELADVYDDYEAFDKVFDCLGLILEQDPLNEEALYKICFWTDFTGRNEESIRLHQRILEKHPFSELAWFNLAAAYQGLKLYEKAIDAYQYAVAVDEKFDYAFRNMGDAYLRLRKYKEAIEVLEKVLELTRPEDVIYEAIGHCYHRLGNYAQARFNYKKASHLNPDDSKLYYKVAVTYILEQQWQPAIKQLEQAMRIHRHVADYNLAMGECYMGLEKYKEAVKYFGLVVRSKPKNRVAWESLLSCLLEAEYFEEAIVQAKAAYEITGQKSIFLFYLSMANYRAGFLKESFLYLELGMQKNAKLMKRFVELYPPVLQHPQVVDILARYKKSKRGGEE